MVKTPDELALMRVSGRLLASVFEMLDEQDLDGMSTLQINDLVEHFITVDLAARPARAKSEQRESLGDSQGD